MEIKARIEKGNRDESCKKIIGAAAATHGTLHKNGKEDPKMLRAEDIEKPI